MRTVLTGCCRKQTLLTEARRFKSKLLTAPSSGGLIVAKVLASVDLLPFIHPFPGRTLVRNIVWKSWLIEAGSQFPIGKYTELDIYYEHQNNTRTAPNQQVNVAGLILNLHF